jgi:hypothetical protein
MAAISEFTVTLRGMKCEVQGEITGPDPSVGIMSAGVEDYTVYDPDGRVLDEITPDEDLLIQTAADQYSIDSAHWDDDDR